VRKVLEALQALNDTTTGGRQGATPGRLAADAHPAHVTGYSALIARALAGAFGPLDPLPAGDTKVREHLQERFRQYGLPPLLTELEQLDHETWLHIDRYNPHRVIRALEVCHITGRPYSAQRTTPQDRTDMRIVRIAMDVPRPQLYAQIDERVDRMMAAGLEEEARALLPHRHLNA
jgi:tRNA dimethylallyltransferase